VFSVAALRRGQGGGVGRGEQPRAAGCFRPGGSRKDSKKGMPSDSFAGGKAKERKTSISPEKSARWREREKSALHKPSLLQPKLLGGE